MAAARRRKAPRAVQQQQWRPRPFDGTPDGDALDVNAPVLIWRDVAPALAEDHTVVLADLRGYGDSDKPAPDTAGLVYSKRSMARDRAGLMRQLGFGQFQLASHDRGARAAHRLVLDHPSAVTRLAILDILPTRHILRNVTRAVATANYQWFFLATGNGIPEYMIAADPGYWVRSFIRQHLGEGKEH